MAETKDKRRAGACSPRKRRPYAPPRIEQIDIVPGEALLSGGCKTAPGPGTTSVCGPYPGTCLGMGS